MADTSPITAEAALAFAPATGLLALLRARQISAVELLDLYLGRIARYNPALNAIVTSNAEGAWALATAADQARARGEDAPLLGLPTTVKDCLDMAGLPATAGVVRYRDRVPTWDAPVVARVKAAGAVILGKTNVPPLAGDWQSDNPIFGRTDNPWDRDRTPGGSTGGGAAALAAGLTALEPGSDIGGSIRIPAAFCGVYGHKSSETAVPRSGHFPGSRLPNPATIMSVQGPLARSAGDLRLALAVIAGPDIGEDAAWRLALPPPRQARLAEYRVAALPTLPWLPIDQSILAAQDALVERLRQAGATVAEASPPELDDFYQYYLLYRRLLNVIMSIGEQPEKLRDQAARLRASGDEILTAAAAGLDVAAGEYIIWLARREHYREVWRRFFRDWDVVLAPVTSVPAFPHTTGRFLERQLVVNGQPMPYHLLSAYPGIATLCGLPATAFPVDLSADGLPIGL